MFYFEHKCEFFTLLSYSYYNTYLSGFKMQYKLTLATLANLINKNKYSFKMAFLIFLESVDESWTVKTNPPMGPEMLLDNRQVRQLHGALAD